MSRLSRYGYYMMLAGRGAAPAPMPMPEDGLCFYAPLKSTPATSEPTPATWTDPTLPNEGYTLSYLQRDSASAASTSIPEVATVEGVPCTYFNAKQYISVPELKWSTTNGDQAFSWWVNFSTPNKERGMIGDCLPSKYSDNFRMSVLSSNKVETTFGGYPNGRILTTQTLTTGVWYHMVAQISSLTAQLYINGELAGDASGKGTTTNNEPFSIGRARDLTRGDIGCQGYMAGIRIYKRALTNEEIWQLYSEFSA